MDIKDVAEQAYKNGYEDGIDHALRNIVSVIKQKAFDLNKDNPKSKFRFYVVELQDLSPILHKLLEESGHPPHDNPILRRFNNGKKENTTN